MKPKFIVLEGIDGSGTTSQATRLVSSWPGSPGAVLTCEPTDGRIGSLIRTALSGEWKVSSRTLALLFAADRQDHLEQISRNLDAGLSVVCDRYALSSWAYQGIDLPILWVKQINAEILVPDLMILLDVEPEVAAQRRAERGGDAEIFDAPKTQRILAKRYREVLPGWPGRVEIIDASRPFDEVAAQIQKLVSTLDVGQDPPSS